jgi:hypothetical protein
MPMPRQLLHSKPIVGHRHDILDDPLLGATVIGQQAGTLPAERRLEESCVT